MRKDHEKVFDVSVLVLKEDGQFAALALEMDVRGYGPTAKDAIEDVLAMLEAQISYAVQKGHPESVWRPAEQKYWDMFEEARKQRFVAAALDHDAPTDRIADLVPLSLVAAQKLGWTSTSA